VRDFRTGFDYVRKAAEQNYAAAQYFLGAEYARGENVTADLKPAAYWYTRVPGPILRSRDGAALQLLQGL
jgi:TPR repeat protein